MKYLMLSNHAEGRRFGSGRLTSEQIHPDSSRDSPSIGRQQSYTLQTTAVGMQWSTIPQWEDKAMGENDIEPGAVLLQNGLR